MPKPYSSDGTCSLYLGDCREILPALGVTADCVIADPPYSETSAEWDRWPDGWLETAASVARSMWCWLPFRQFAAPPYRGQEFAAAGWRLSHDVEAEWDHAVWEKANGSSPSSGSRRVHEPVSHWYQGSWNEICRQVPRVPHDGPFKGTIRKKPDRAGHHRAPSSRRRLVRRRPPRCPLGHQGAEHARESHPPVRKPVPVLSLLIGYACHPPASWSTRSPVQVPRSTQPGCPAAARSASSCTSLTPTLPRAALAKPTCSAVPRERCHPDQRREENGDA